MPAITLFSSRLLLVATCQAGTSGWRHLMNVLQWKRATKLCYVRQTLAVNSGVSGQKFTNVFVSRRGIILGVNTPIRIVILSFTAE